jgi:hypothetical protein
MLRKKETHKNTKEQSQRLIHGNGIWWGQDWHTKLDNGLDYWRKALANHQRCNTVT